MEAAASARNIDGILKEIEITVNEDYISKVKENLSETLATRYIDYTRIKEMAQQAREHCLIPEYTESYFKKALIKAGGKIKERKDKLMAIESIPFDIRKIADEDNFKKNYGQVLKKYPKITFDKEVTFNTPDAEFISFGHPIFETVMAWVEANLIECLINGATFIDPDGRLNGYILFYEGEIKDGTGAIAGKRLFSFYQDIGDRGLEIGESSKPVVPINPAFIWDLVEENNPQSPISNHQFPIPPY